MSLPSRLAATRPRNSPATGTGPPAENKFHIQPAIAQVMHDDRGFSQRPLSPTALARSSFPDPRKPHRVVIGRRDMDAENHPDPAARVSILLGEHSACLAESRPVRNPPASPQAAARSPVPPGSVAASLVNCRSPSEPPPSGRAGSCPHPDRRPPPDMRNTGAGRWPHDQGASIRNADR